LLSNIFVNICLFVLAVKLSVVAHEAGHAVFATLVGGVPKRIVLGMHHEVARFYYKNVKIIVNSIMRAGLAFSAFEYSTNIRWRLLAYSIGGVTFNFCLAGLLYLLFGFDMNILNGQSGINPVTPLIVSNMLAGIGNLIPFYSTHGGQRHASDGLSILKIPFLKKSELSKLGMTTHLLDSYDLMEERKYQEAIEKIEEIKKMSSEMRMMDVELGICYLKLGDIEKCLDTLRSMEELFDGDEYNAYKPYYFNGLAWIYLIKEEYKLADEYSERARKLAPDVEAIAGTRGALLIEIGKLNEGEALLSSDIDFNLPNRNTVTDSAYLAYTFHSRNQKKISDKYREFVMKNVDTLDFDEKILVERVLNKIN